MVSSHQVHTWDQGLLYLSTTPWSLYAWTIHETINTMVSSHQFHTWDQGPLDLSTIPWSLLINSIHETRDHSICLYITMVSSYQFYTWEYGLLYLYTQQHGLFSPITYMRSWTTLSIYTTPWSLLTSFIHETRDHSIYLYNTIVSSRQLYTWDQGPLCIYIMVSSHQFHTWDQGPLYLYTTTWSLHANSIHETIDHSIYIMVSSHQFNTWDHRPLCQFNIMVSSH